MWTPKWFDALFIAITSPVSWVAAGIVLVLLAGLLLRAAWRLACRAMRKGGTT